MNNISYNAPYSISEAAALLAELPDARILAGGTDLIARWKKMHFFDMNLIDIRNIAELSVIEPTDTGFFIGAGVTMDRVNENEHIVKKYPILAEAAGKVGSVQVRNMATIGGNTCNAAPSADTVLPLMVYDATAVVAAKESQRKVSLREFFTGPGKTVLQKGEILKGFLLPETPKNARVSFAKHSRRAGMDLATVGIALLLATDNESITNLRIVLGAVGPVPIYVNGLSEFVGQKMDDAAKNKIADTATAAASPITDVRGSKEYREAMVRRNVIYCLEKALN